MGELHKLRTHIVVKTPHIDFFVVGNIVREYAEMWTQFLSPKHHLPYLRFMATTIPYGGHAANNWQVLAHFRPVLVIGLDDS